MNTGPDISYAVGVLARHACKPTLAACDMVVHLMQHLRGTADKGIRFSGSSLDMHVFTGSDCWVGDVLSRRSTTGYYVVFAAGGPITWQSKLQSTVSPSSMQSEYQAMFGAMQELV